jgi:hypothetical protein
MAPLRGRTSRKNGIPKISAKSFMSSKIDSVSLGGLIAVDRRNGWTLDEITAPLD